jgi:hypothetical protein
MDAKDLTQALRISQLAQIGAGLFTAIANAAAAGRDTVTADELASSFESKDAALLQLAVSIVRAKTEGR